MVRVLKMEERRRAHLGHFFHQIATGTYGWILLMVETADLLGTGGQKDGSTTIVVADVAIYRSRVPI